MCLEHRFEGNRTRVRCASNIGSMVSAPKSSCNQHKAFFDAGRNKRRRDKPYLRQNHYLCTTINNYEYAGEVRYRGGGSRSRRLRSSLCGGSDGRKDATHHYGHEQGGADVVQPSRRWHCQGTNRSRNRRLRRTHGRGYGQDHHTIPHAQPLERACHVESARPMRQGTLYLGLATGD